MPTTCLPKRTIRLAPRDQSALRGTGPVKTVVLGLCNAATAAALKAALSPRGLTVVTAAGPEDARQRALGQRDTAVVIPVADQAHGGLLATAKIVTALPTCKVVLVAPQHDERVEAFAEFIDATVVFETDGLTAIVNAI
jgi:hypothetical protein